MNLINAFAAAVNGALATYWFAEGEPVAGAIAAGAALFCALVFIALAAADR